MFIRTNLLTLFLLLYTPLILSQTFQRELNSIPFRDASGDIKNVFSGGINNFEFQFIDIDNDGDMDIPFLDSDNSYGLYLNTGTNNSAEYILSLSPPAGFYARSWFYFADIDNDGDLDLFTSGADNYILFLRNTGSNTSPNFEIAEDTLKDEDNNPIFTEFSSNPLFCDVDNDGDMDFLSGNSAGTVTFYENTGTASLYSFRFITNQWQDIIIISADNQRHGASSLDFADIDNDQDKDLFWGDFFSKSLYFIENQGTPSVPEMEVILRVYPPNEDSLYTSGFNMPRFVDIDGDNDQDLFVSVLYDPTVPQSLIYYRNEGNNVQPDFNFITSNFLPTLDAGTESIPCFTDMDNDGDPDLFIGSSKNPEGSVFYFENTGTASSPSFILADSVYAGITGELSLAPAAADLDGDGDNDLLVGNFDGTIGYYRNDGTLSTPAFVFIGNLTDHNLQTIDIGLIARPFLIDFNKDSATDLVIGSFSGEIALFRNGGTALSFSFIHEPSYFGSIDVGDNSSPHLLDYDNDGDLDLFTGNRTGNIYYYNNNGSNVLPLWELDTNQFIEEFRGAVTAPVFCDIDNDTDYDLFIGNIKGGLYFFRNTLITGLDPAEQTTGNLLSIAVFPNPFNSVTNIRVDIPEHDFYKIIIYNSIGEVVYNIFADNLYPGKYSFPWKGTNNFNYPAASGNYIVAVISSSYSKFNNIILLK